MKMGIRKPNVKKSISARTTGRATRAVKKAVIPGYGKKGTGIIKDPKKAAYNAVYNRTTVSTMPKVSGSFSQKHRSGGKDIHNTSADVKSQRQEKVGIWRFLIIIGVTMILAGVMLLASSPVAGVISLLIGLVEVIFARGKLSDIKKNTNRARAIRRTTYWSGRWT